MPFEVKAPIQISDGTAYNRMVEQAFQKMEQVIECSEKLFDREMLIPHHPLKSTLGNFEGFGREREGGEYG